eukprot:COSAG02_NODE_556_length_20390_cov_88.575230_4_plen_74_part_00
MFDASNDLLRTRNSAIDTSDHLRKLVARTNENYMYTLVVLGIGEEKVCRHLLVLFASHARLRTFVFVALRDLR